jgi:FkbM family methyltransferase
MRGNLHNELSKLDVKTIFDIGACNFDDSISFKLKYPNAEVYAVEADPSNYIKNYKRAEKYGVKPFHFAMSNETGYTTFYPSLFETEKKIEWRYAGSIIKPLLKPDTNESLTHRVVYDTEGIDIPTKRFDEFCEEINVVKIDLLHIDVEGAEYKVMKSLGNIRPELIFSETHHYKVKSFDNEINLEEFDDLMSSLGYDIIERLEYDTLYKKRNN